MNPGRSDRAKQERVRKRLAVIRGLVALLLALGVAALLRLAGLSDLTLRELAVAVEATLVTTAVLLGGLELGWDQLFSFDRHYLLIPLSATVLLFGLYILLMPELRVVILMGWFVVLLMMVGLAGLPEEPTDLDELLLRADSGLYAAKRAGRDWVWGVGVGPLGIAPRGY